MSFILQVFCELDFQYAGLHFKSKCSCGNTLRRNLQRSTSCSLQCKGNSSQVCGGYVSISLYYKQGTYHALLHVQFYLYTSLWAPISITQIQVYPNFLISLHLYAEKKNGL